MNEWWVLHKQILNSYIIVTILFRPTISSMMIHTLLFKVFSCWNDPFVTINSRDDEN